MKNKIINVLLPLIINQKGIKKSRETEPCASTNVDTRNDTPTFANIVKKKVQKNAAVVVKSGSEKKVEAHKADDIERKVANVLIKKNI